MRLLKSIYGLEQASHEWCKLFRHIFSSLGLKRATSDTSLHTMNHPMHGICIVLVYVDDILVVSDSLEWIESAKRVIGEQFHMTDFGEAQFIFGMDIVINGEAGTIGLSHEQYIKEIIEKYNMPDNTPYKVPMAPMHCRDGEVASDHENVALSPLEHETFRAILGSLSSAGGRRLLQSCIYNRSSDYYSPSSEQGTWESPMEGYPKILPHTSSCSRIHTDHNAITIMTCAHAQ
jgi:hypothetical protein